MHVISLPMIFIFLSYERKEASVVVTTVASCTAGTVVFFRLAIVGVTSEVTSSPTQQIFLCGNELMRRGSLSNLASYHNITCLNAL